MLRILYYLLKTYKISKRNKQLKINKRSTFTYHYLLYCKDMVKYMGKPTRYVTASYDFYSSKISFKLHQNLQTILINLETILCLYNLVIVNNTFR